MMTTPARFLTVFSITVAAACSLCAQSGKSPRFGVENRPPPDASPLTLNPEAWDSFVSWDSKRMFGEGSEQIFVISTSYLSEVSLWGYRIAQSTFKPGIEWASPLFGGESYSELFAYIPTNSARYSQQLWLYGGWRYALNNWSDVDIGGTFIWADKRLAGPGLPATDGWKSRGTIYLGLIGRHWLRPNAYVVYDFSLDQTEGMLALMPEIEAAQLGINVEGLSLGATAKISYLHAARWMGDPGDSLPSWQNSYTYWEAGAYAQYLFHSGWMKGASTRIGLKYSGNNDGTTHANPANADPGPANQLGFYLDVGYSF